MRPFFLHPLTINLPQMTPSRGLVLDRRAPSCGLVLDRRILPSRGLVLDRRAYLRCCLVLDRDTTPHPPCGLVLDRCALILSRTPRWVRLSSFSSAKNSTLLPLGCLLSSFFLFRCGIG